MARAENTQVVETLERFYREYYAEEIGELAQGYPTERKSLYVDWDDLYQFDPDLADDVRAQPAQLLDYAEEALRRYDLPVDVKLGQAHVRIRDLPEKTDIRDIRHSHHGSLLAISGIVRKATDVRPKITTAAFECQRCGTLTRIPMPEGNFQEPHECQGCERQGPFRVNFDQSEFVDAQKLRIQESPEGLRGGETPQSIDVHIEDDVTGRVTAGDHVTVVGILKLDQQGTDGDQSAMFDVFMEGSSIEIDDEEFEEMDISDAEKKRIVELSNAEDLYEKMVGAIAPSIYGYEDQKLAMILQLFSGVTKHLPDESRIRGDMHMLLVGDPGTGKSQLLQYIRHIAPRSVYTSGKGTSSAGLTAAAVRDDFAEGQQWSLEAGALVLADRGIAAVDELDKMDAGDQSAMHEALEQQSYHPNSEILLADGNRIDIGEFVDREMAAREDEVVEGVDCEILPVEDVGVHSVDLDSNTVEKLPVDRVSRHEAPDEFVRVSFSNGRDVLVTPEHPMFVEAGGEVGTVEARDLEEGAFVPAPRQLPNAATPVELDGEPKRGKEKDVELPETLSSDLAELLGLLVAEGHSYAGSAHEIGFSNQDERLLEHAASLMQSVTGMESTDTTNEAGTVTKRWISTKLYRWFESNFPEVMGTAREKRIPARVLGASQEEIRRFLVGAFAGDGGVESEAMSFSTASDGLARDYADALAKLGVASRIHHDTAEDSWKVYVMGDSTERFVETVVQEADDRYEDAMAFAERSLERRTEGVEEQADLRFYRVTDVERVPNEGEYECEWVYDVTVEPTNTFVSEGVVLHNSISISKAGINATLKARCSLLGAANPTYGRFDQYEPIGEQIDLEPALISRFDLIFTVTDNPDEEKDADLAEHILRSNYAGELHTHRQQTTNSNHDAEEVAAVTDTVAPTIEPELLRKYIAFAKRTCFPTMSDAAKQVIQDFYVDLRAKGTAEDAPVPVTARKLEALVRLAEASARVRLSDTVAVEDAERATNIVEATLRDIGMDPETDQFDADVVETGTSKSQRDRIKNLKGLVADIEDEYDEGAPVDVVLERAEEVGMDTAKAEHEIEQLKQKGEVYEPRTDYLRTT